MYLSWAVALAPEEETEEVMEDNREPSRLRLTPSDLLPPARDSPTGS